MYVQYRDGEWRITDLISDDYYYCMINDSEDEECIRTPSGPGIMYVLTPVVGPNEPVCGAPRLRNMIYIQSNHVFNGVDSG